MKIRLKILRKRPYNKATSHHIGKLKAKLAKLKEESLQRSSGGTKGQGFHVKKSGDATVVLVGFPSVGKSTLLNNITNAESKVGAYQFTTLDIVPGVMEHKNAKIQVFDIPFRESSQVQAAVREEVRKYSPLQELQI